MAATNRNKYLASPVGIRERFYSRIAYISQNGCWIWNGLASYGLMTISNSKIGAHRLSWLLHMGEIPDGLLVCHKCDVRKCVNPNHLFLGTHHDNTADMIKKKRNHPNPPRGINHPRAKLSEDDVRFIRSSKLSHTELGNKFNVNYVTILFVRSGRTWKHVQ